MKLKALGVLLIVIVATIPVYSLIRYLQKRMRPRESFGRLFLFMVSALAVIFLVTFLIVLIIGKLFHDASR